MAGTATGHYVSLWRYGVCWGLCMSETRERCYLRKRMRLEDVSYSDPNMVYFATMCTTDKQRVFEDPLLARDVVDALLWRRDKGIIRLYAYCLMPDHLHLALSPTEEQASVGSVIGQFKSFTTMIYRKHEGEGQLWQRSWYDHIARRDEDTIAICQYILENPIRGGLAETADLWPYSGMPDILPL